MNAPPRQRQQSQPSGGKFLSGAEFNPRRDMIDYARTLCDPERYPPVRLGGETMVQTGLTTLHNVFSYTPASNATSASVVIHPRAWNPFLASVTSSAPYNYASTLGFATSFQTLQSLAAAARVLSCKIKVYTTASATNDNGAITAGLCPKDPGKLSTSASFVGQSAGDIIAANNASPVYQYNVSMSGYPINTSVVSGTGGALTGPLATQGFNEFASEDWTTTTPLKDGLSVFWLPEDPSSMTFSSDRLRPTLEYVTVAGSPPVIGSTPYLRTEIQDPFFCFGLTGLTANTAVNFEIFLNLEYTVTAGASNVIETRAGTMSSTQSFGIVKQIGGNLQNTVEPDPESSLGQKLWNVGKAAVSGGLSRMSQFIFGSSDVGKAVEALWT
jgi:hypothetical protein